MPFLGMPGDDSIIDVYNQLCEEFPEIEGELEAQNIRTLGTYFFQRADFYFNNGSTIQSVDDIKGKKIGVTNATLGIILNNLGAAPVTITNADAYTSMDSGVIEGLVHHQCFLRTTAVVDQINSGTKFGEGGVIREMCKYIMNNDSYNKLPDDLKALLDETFQEIVIASNESDKGMAAGVQQQLEGMGANINTLTEDEYKPILDEAEKVQGEVISELEGRGVPAGDIVARIHELAK